AAEAAKKAAAAVSAVSGEQILKAIVDAVEKGDQEGAKADAATNPIAAAIGAGAEAAEAAKKAAAAVSAVSGEQILKAIVDAVEKGEQEGAKADAATNPIAAAIGAGAEAAAAFGEDEMKKDDKIAAAIVLRGLAKDGKFAAAAGNANK
ncbi:variable large family protein, partial [Borreliella bissettiae]|uniref:variable large family protein n=1 Tax=Borrelia bissettiae TaxID=64897 RepID=UPI001E3D514B